MMEHIRQYDWCSSEPDLYFVKEEDVDNCVIERIIRNKFRDPMISSDSEDERPRPKIDWGQVFKRKNIEEKLHRVYVPGLRTPAPYPKLSALTKQQHFQCLKVLCAENPNVLPMQYIPAPTKMDHAAFKELKEIYLKEQKEYIEWAKSIWSSNHCIRALRPKPTIETVYEAEFKMRASEMKSFPKKYGMAAHIPLVNETKKCVLTYEKDLIKVKTADLPKVDVPKQIGKKLVIMRPCPVPVPCNKHPCWFILPNEKSMSVLPLTEIHKQLAEYAIDNACQFVASESALKCLVEMDRNWLIPISVCPVIDADDQKINIIVFGSEFSAQRSSAMTRTYRAFRHLLEYSLIPSSEKIKLLINTSNESCDKIDMDNLNCTDDMDLMTSDDDDDNLVINEDAISLDSMKEKEQQRIDDNDVTDTNEPIADEMNTSTDTVDGANKTKDLFNCSCKDSTFQNPPPRSFTKWRLKNATDGETLNLIVHCSHKMKNETGEVLLEPLPEYQIELGGSTQSEHKINSLALSLYLRKNASILNVRVDSLSGDVVTMDHIEMKDLIKEHGDVMQNVSNVLFETFHQLQGLLPGNYVLQHAPNQGANAFLYASHVKGIGQKLVLNFDLSTNLEDDEDAKGVKKAPLLTPVLLPVHKFRKMLPCAFTPYENMLAKDQKKPGTRQKTPPQAIKWPKKTKNRKRKRKNNSQQ